MSGLRLIEEQKQDRLRGLRPLRGGSSLERLPPERVVAIDWSGALAPSAQRKAIWIASISAAGITLEGGRLRAEVEAWLIKAACATPRMVVGLDFSFSYPEWFHVEHYCRDVFELWARVEEHGERWLREPHAHFWGRTAGGKRPATHHAPGWLGYRACELGAKSGNTLPKSSFQIGGAGAVGTGSLRGIPMLARLRRAGFSVWPFDPPRPPVLIEIYPRLLTGPVVKSSAAAREHYLAQPEYAGLDTAVFAKACGSEDAFDALISALAMHRHADELATLPTVTDLLALTEGAIWRPGWKQG